MPRVRNATKPLPPDVRKAFARRLKELRRLRGHMRARSFAIALGIEENRYTRYKRAEAEPSLTLIHTICSTLQVTPNDLFGIVSPAVPNAVAEGRLANIPNGLALLEEFHDRLGECLQLVSSFTTDDPHSGCASTPG